MVCPCARGGDLWGEFWWDDDEASETYTEQVTHCPGCGRPLERKILKATTVSVR